MAGHTSSSALSVDMGHGQGALSHRCQRIMRHDDQAAGPGQRALHWDLRDDTVHDVVVREAWISFLSSWWKTCSVIAFVVGRPKVGMVADFPASCPLGSSIRLLARARGLV